MTTKSPVCDKETAASAADSTAEVSLLQDASFLGSANQEIVSAGLIYCLGHKDSYPLHSAHPVLMWADVHGLQPQHSRHIKGPRHIDIADWIVPEDS